MPMLYEALSIREQSSAGQKGGLRTGHDVALAPDTDDKMSRQLAWSHLADLNFEFDIGVIRDIAEDLRPMRSYRFLELL